MTESDGKVPTAIEVREDLDLEVKTTQTTFIMYSTSYMPLSR